MDNDSYLLLSCNPCYLFNVSFGKKKSFSGSGPTWWKDSVVTPTMPHGIPYTTSYAVPPGKSTGIWTSFATVWNAASPYTMAKTTNSSPWNVATMLNREFLVPRLRCSRKKIILPLLWEDRRILPESWRKSGRLQPCKLIYTPLLSGPLECLTDGSDGCTAWCCAPPLHNTHPVYLYPIGRRCCEATANHHKVLSSQNMHGDNMEIG